MKHSTKKKIKVEETISHVEFKTLKFSKCMVLKKEMKCFISFAIRTADRFIRKANKMVIITKL